MLDSCTWARVACPVFILACRQVRRDTTKSSCALPEVPMVTGIRFPVANSCRQTHTLCSATIRDLPVKRVGRGDLSDPQDGVSNSLSVPQPSMLSLEGSSGVIASPQAPFPTDFVTLPVSASHRRFGSFLHSREKAGTTNRHALHSKHAQQRTSFQPRSLAGRTVSDVHAQTWLDA